ncbi:MAG: glycoside hydrolase family 88 protein [Kiritimatiellae bacterium]|nr:glycoside hydrolase family 88 protein [Kiritimatiellia bacterium]
MTRRDFLPLLLGAALPRFAWADDTAPEDTPAARARTAWRAFCAAYWNPESHLFNKVKDRPRPPLDFWLTAQVWDCAMDAAEHFKDAEDKRRVTDLFDAFLARHRYWKRNPYNDDICWWTIACTRAYRITHEERFLQRAKRVFDDLSVRESDSQLGGGFWWRSDEHTSKNACVNGPAIITAMELADLTHENRYVTQATELYAWLRKTLFNAETGAVRDNINRRHRVAPMCFTYNQGTFIGAALRLYRQTQQPDFLQDARTAAAFLCKYLAPRGTLRGEGQGDGGAFKGIAVRYLTELARLPENETFAAFLKKNAQTAWDNRRASDGLIGPDWSRRPPDQMAIECQTAASAVVLLILASGLK